MLLARGPGLSYLWNTAAGLLRGSRNRPLFYREAIMNPERRADGGGVENKKIGTSEIESHAIEANAIEANPIEASHIEANPIEANPIEANAIDANVIEPLDPQSPDAV